MMKRLLTLLACALGLFSAVHAQVVTITAGTQISAISPINNGTPEGAFEVIYVQSAINQAGSITRLAFEKADGTDLVPLTGVVIYLKTTPNTGFTDGLLDTLGYQRVYVGNFPSATPAGYQEVVFQRPFAYANAPGQNLSVLVLRKNGNVQATIGPRTRFLYGITTNPVRIACRRYNGTVPATSATTLVATNVLPNLRLTFGTPTAARTGALAGATHLYPQPASGFVTLDAASSTGPLTYWLTDELGRTVWAAALLPARADGQHVLALNDLPAGTYYLHLAGTARREVLRLVRQ